MNGYVQMIIIIVFGLVVGWLACQIVELDQSWGRMQQQINKHELMINPVYLVEHKYPENLQPKGWR